MRSPEKEGSADGGKEPTLAWDLEILSTNRCGNGKAQVPRCKCFPSLTSHHWSVAIFFLSLSFFFTSKLFASILKWGIFCIKICISSVCWKIQRCAILQPALPLDNIRGKQFLLGNWGRVLFIAIVLRTAVPSPLPQPCTPGCFCLTYLSFYLQHET